MGDVYSVMLKFKLRKGMKRGALADTLRTWMREQEKDTPGKPGVYWCWKESREAGIRPDSLRGLCKVVLAFHQGDGRFYSATSSNDMEVYRSAFKATYSWLGVMEDFFRKMAWYLDEGSELAVGRDSGWDKYKVELSETGEPEVWECHHCKS